MVIKNLCEKKLSAMNNKVIKYNVCESKCDSQMHYGIQIVEDVGENHNEETIEGISTSENFVYNLLSYLYDNIIDTVHFRDIVDDYILESEYSL